MEETKEQNTQENATVEELLTKIDEIKAGSVNKEDYEKLKEENVKLVQSITNNRTVIKEEEQPTKDEIIERCKERFQKVGKGTSYDTVKALVENYKDLKEMGIEQEGVDEEIVEQLEKFIEDANGDSNLFKALTNAKIKA